LKRNSHAFNNDGNGIFVKQNFLLKVRSLNEPLFQKLRYVIAPPNTNHSFNFFGVRVEG